MATDRDALIALCEKLGLTRRDSEDPNGREYAVLERVAVDLRDPPQLPAEDQRVILGSGRTGLFGGSVEFTFDPDGNVIEHRIEE